MITTQFSTPPSLHRQDRSLTMREFHLTPFPNEGFCSRCSRLCKKVCHKCEDAPSYDCKRQITYYCSVKCQLLDWPTHHGTCRARQARVKLLRVVEVLQVIWYAVRREAFEWELERMTSWKAETEDDGTVRQLEIPQLQFVAKDRDIIREDDGRREQIVYQRFIDRDGEGWTKGEMNAALTFGSCQFAVRMLHAPLRTMIAGLYSKTEEIYFQPQRCKVNVTRVWVNCADEQTVAKVEGAAIIEENQTLGQLRTLNVVNQEGLGNLDESEAPDADENISLQSSYAGTIGTEATVVHNDVRPEDANWAAYVHGHDDEPQHDKTQDFNKISLVHDVATQNRCHPKVDGYYSEQDLGETAGLHHEATVDVGIERQRNRGKDGLEGCFTLDNEFAHFNHDQDMHNTQQGHDVTSDWKRVPAADNVQSGVVLNDPELQNFGQPGYSGHWLRTSKWVRRSPKKENLHDPTDDSREKSDSDNHDVQDGPFIKSEAELGETRVHDLETGNEFEDLVTFDGITKKPEQQTLIEALTQTSPSEEHEHEQPLVAEAYSQAALDAYHCALKIKLSNGEVWVFDPTAAQFGYTHILLPLGEYLVRMKAPPSSVCSHPFGTVKSNMEENVAWKQLHKLGRDVTDDTNLGEQEIRRRLQWGAMDGIIEEAISHVLGLQKELEKVKIKEQMEKEKEENATNYPKKKPAFNSGLSANRFSTAIKIPSLRASNLLPKKSMGAKEGPEIGYKRLLRASAIEHDILLSATLAQFTSILSLGRESLYTQSSRASRDNRVKLWLLYRSFHERFPTPQTEPPKSYEAVKKECKKATKEIARREKENRSRMKKEVKEMKRESRRIVREHERRQKELLKRIERLMRVLDAQSNSERPHNLPMLPLVSTNIQGMDIIGPAALGADLAAFDGEGDGEDGHGAFEEGEDLGPPLSGMTEQELNALEDFAEHLEWAERTGLIGRLDLLSPTA